MGNTQVNSGHVDKLNAMTLSPFLKIFYEQYRVFFYGASYLIALVALLVWLLSWHVLTLTENR